MLALGKAKASDRRTSARVPVDVAVSATSDHNFYTGFARDISEGGVFIACEAPPSIGTIVAFELSLAPGKGKVSIKGEVRWVRATSDNPKEAPLGCGVRFHRLSPRVATAINAFIHDRREALFYPDDDEG